MSFQHHAFLLPFSKQCSGVYFESTFLMGWSVQGHLQWAPLPCLAAECLDLESLQPFSPNHGLIMRGVLVSILRFCSLKQPLMGHHRFGSLLITCVSWGGFSNYLLASCYHLRFPTSKLSQFRKMEKKICRDALISFFCSNSLDSSSRPGGL